jgi:polyisoprenyl-teichoic acid--peptidoglycan teichoic acid transferase
MDRHHPPHHDEGDGDGGSGAGRRIGDDGGAWVVGADRDASAHRDGVEGWGNVEDRDGVEGWDDWEDGEDWAHGADWDDWEDGEDWAHGADWDGDERTPGADDGHGVPGRTRPGRSLRQWGVLATGVVVTVACLVAAIGLGTVWRKWGQFERVEASELSVANPDQPQNLLIVGSDTRDVIDATDPNAAVFHGGDGYAGGQRADTMIVLRYDPVLERLDILSVPRDLWVPIAGKGTTERINTAYSYDQGPDVLLRTLQDVLDIPIHHYAEIDFRGFQDLVDEIGGVPLYFDTLYRDTMSGFVVSEPGCTTVGGQEALAFVRSRELQHMTATGTWETDLTADLGRISRQQYFLRRALEEARDSLSVLRPTEMNRMLDIGIEHVRLDKDLPPTRLAAMGQRFAEFEGDSIETHTLPVVGHTTGGGASVLLLQEAEAQPVLNVFRGLPRDHVDAAWVDLRILNGSGLRGQAGDVEEAFESIGFSVSGVGDVPGVEGDPLERTRVRHGPGGRELAGLVESHLTRGGELREDPDLASSRVVVETGSDFTTVEQVPRSAAVPVEPNGLGATDGAERGGTVDSGIDRSLSGPTSSTTLPSAPAVIGHVPGEAPEGLDCG